MDEIVDSTERLSAGQEHEALFNYLLKLIPPLEPVEFVEFQRFLLYSPGANLLRWYSLQADTTDYYITEAIARDLNALMLPADKLVTMPKAADAFTMLAGKTKGGWIPLFTHGVFLFLANYDPLEPLPNGVPACLVQKVLLTANQYDVLCDLWHGILSEQADRPKVELPPLPEDDKDRSKWLELLGVLEKDVAWSLKALRFQQIPFPLCELSLKLLPTVLDQQYLFSQQLFPFLTFQNLMFLAYEGDSDSIVAQLDLKLNGLTPILFHAVPKDVQSELKVCFGSALQSTKLSVSLIESNLNDVSGFLDALLNQALELKVSDIHLEPLITEPTYRFRFRMDGVLIPVLNITEDMAQGLINKIKLASGMEISDKRQPKDGSFTHQLQGMEFDIRVSIIPQHTDGEQVVLRVLDLRKAPGSLEELGFSVTDTLLINKALSFDHGLFLVSGPTGSGKTTTLYAAVRSLPLDSYALMTVEDPVEYKIENGAQFCVTPTMCYERLLKHLLRADPDFLMVGEVRDAATAQTALVAANTGHLVLTTLHANDAISSIFRLQDLGVPSVLLADASRLIISQRLIRKLCRRCRIKRPMTAPERATFLHNGFPKECLDSNLYMARGCHACHYSGYKNRFAVAESLFFTQDLADAVGRGATRQELFNLAEKQGYHTMYRAGLARVLSGETSFKEISSLAIHTAL